MQYAGASSCRGGEGRRSFGLTAPTATQYLVKVDHSQIFIAYGIAQSDLSIEEVTVGIEYVDIADNPVEVLQLGQVDILLCRLEEVELQLRGATFLLIGDDRVVYLAEDFEYLLLIGESLFVVCRQSCLVLGLFLPEGDKWSYEVAGYIGEGRFKETLKFIVFKTTDQADGEPGETVGICDA